MLSSLGFQFVMYISAAKDEFGFSLPSQRVAIQVIVLLKNKEDCLISF